MQPTLPRGIIVIVLLITLISFKALESFKSTQLSTTLDLDVDNVRRRYSGDGVGVLVPTRSRRRRRHLCRDLPAAGDRPHPRRGGARRFRVRLLPLVQKSSAKEEASRSAVSHFEVFVFRLLKNYSKTSIRNYSVCSALVVLLSFGVLGR